MEKKSPSAEESIIQTLGIDHAKGSKKKKVVLIGLLIIVLAAVAAYMRPNSNGKTPQFKTEEALRGDLTVTVSATGDLAPTGEVDVGSELSGIITRVEVDFNDRVKKGQALAYLDDTKFAASVRASRAALAAAKAQLAQTQATVLQKQQNLNRLRRAGSLSSGKALSPYDLESAEADLERAKADKASAEATIQQAQANLVVDEINLAKTVIVSPVNGTVLLRDVDPGQTVAASLQAPVLFTLAEDLTHMELQVDVDEADVGQVREGQEASFTVDAYPERTFQARITKVRFGSSTMENKNSTSTTTSTTSGVVTYTTSLAVENPDLALRPGMTATADIVVEKIENAVLVPNAALRFTPPMTTKAKDSRGLIGMLLPRPPSRTSQAAKATGKNRQPKVWVLDQGQPKPIPVTIGATDGTHTVITQGEVAPGSRVIVDLQTVTS